MRINFNRLIFLSLSLLFFLFNYALASSAQPKNRKTFKPKLRLLSLRRPTTSILAFIRRNILDEEYTRGGMEGIEKISLQRL